MARHQQRVVDERAEVEAGRARLVAFMESAEFQGVDAAEQERLQRQESIMAALSGVLGQRINAL